MKTNKKLHVKVGDKIKVMSGNQKRFDWSNYNSKPEKINCNN